MPEQDRMAAPSSNQGDSSTESSTGHTSSTSMSPTEDPPPPPTPLAESEHLQADLLLNAQAPPSSSSSSSPSSSESSSNDLPKATTNGNTPNGAAPGTAATGSKTSKEPSPEKVATSNGHDGSQRATVIVRAEHSQSALKTRNGDHEDHEEGDTEPDGRLYHKLPHWSHHIAVIDNVDIKDCLISGGSDYGQLAFFSETGEIILEIDEIAVAGLTSGNLEELLARSARHTFKVVAGAHGLPLELREYLSRRFARGSLDHQLQEVIRDNVYSRTVPFTTRPPKEHEIDGIDYQFVAKQHFIEMDRAGLLLESGVYCNHYYGTPLPKCNSTAKSDEKSSNGAKGGNSGDQEHQEKRDMWRNGSTRRKRNRSTVVAIDAASLPYGWERISDPHYGVYYIDHINKRTQYERPYEIELVKGVAGFGFTLIEIDRGLVVVKSLSQGGSAHASGIIHSGDVLVSVAGVSVAGLQHSDIAHLFSTFQVGDRIRLTFARGYQLPLGITDEDYDIISLKIVKGAQGFGFTISEGHNGQKVKKILDVERCCELRQSDILLSINGTDLTTLTHLDVVETLKQCQINEPIDFIVKRKKRFRSKTPTPSSLEEAPSRTGASHQSSTLPLRNCKTPTTEMFYQQQQPSQTKLQPMPPQYHVPSNVPLGYSGMAPEYGTYLETVALANGAHYATLPMSSFEGPVEGRFAQYPTEENLYGSQIEYSTAPLSLKNQSGAMLASGSPIKSPAETGVIYGTSPGATTDVDYEYIQVTLARTENGFGFRIIGGAEEGSNVAIGSIVLGGSAHAEGTLKAGDEIISINETTVAGANHQDVVQLMSHTGGAVRIVVRRKRYLDAYDVTLYRHDGEGYGFVIISCGNCALIGRIIEGSPAHRCQRLHIRDRIIAVNGADVTNLSHPEIVNMIKESGDALHLRIMPSDCYTVELIRGPNGYGFSIRGGAEFAGMPLFILAIAPNGPATSLLQVGDEILEINDCPTSGMTHQDAVRLISQSGGSVRLRLRHNFGSTDMLSATDTGVQLSRLPSPMPMAMSPGSPTPVAYQQQHSPQYGTATNPANLIVQSPQYILSGAVPY